MYIGCTLGLDVMALCKLIRHGYKGYNKKRSRIKFVYVDLQ